MSKRQRGANYTLCTDQLRRVANRVCELFYDTLTESNRSHMQTQADRRKHWTTIVLEETGDGGWRATKIGVDVEGRGETAAAAAESYCRAVEMGDNGDE